MRDTYPQQQWSDSTHFNLPLQSVLLSLQCLVDTTRTKTAQLYSEIEVVDADSIPFVAVTLLTPTDGMTGGETVLQKGDGSEMSVGFPQAGYLLVLQVCHCAGNTIQEHLCNLGTLVQFGNTCAV